jgi:hypothetical protein
LLCKRRGQISPTVWFLPEQAKERFAAATNTVTKTKIVSEQRGAGRSTGSADASVHEVTGPEAQHCVPLTDPRRSRQTPSQRLELLQLSFGYRAVVLRRLT